MRRWLTVFLLILLPLQLSWAVAATYCAHETDPKVNHIGHHEHRHDKAEKASDASDASDALNASGDSSAPGERDSPDGTKIEQPGDKALTCVDDDCGFCHLGHSQPVASTPIVLPAMTDPVVAGSVPDVWSSRGPDRRERPNWRAA
jgi:hypothetical protein